VNRTQEKGDGGVGGWNTISAADVLKTRRKFGKRRVGAKIKDVREKSRKRRKFVSRGTINGGVQVVPRWQEEYDGIGKGANSIRGGWTQEG